MSIIDDVKAKTGVDIVPMSLEIFGILKEGTDGLWKQEDTQFLHELAIMIAEQKIYSSLAPTPEKKAEYDRNLLHLAATVKGEIAIRSMKINHSSQDTVVRIITAVIKTVASALVSSFVESLTKKAAGQI